MNSKDPFIVAVKYLFPLRYERKNQLAIDAGVNESQLSALFRWSKPPGKEVQTKIAAAFNMDWVDFLQLGKEVLAGKRDGLVPTHAPEKVNRSQKRYEPFPGFSETLALSVKDRPRFIKQMAGKQNGFDPWRSAEGDTQLKEKPEFDADVQRLIDGDVTEIDLYQEYDVFFKKHVKKVLKAIAKKEAGPKPDD